MKMKQHHLPWQLLVAAAVALSACGSSTAKTTPTDSGGADLQQTDVAAANDRATDVPDGGSTADVPIVGAEDSGTTISDAATVECAPLPSGPVKPSGTAPQQAAGPTVTSTVTRPELAAAAADADYTIVKALAHGGAVGGTGVSTPDGGAPDPTGGVAYALNDNWDPLANGIGDPSTFTPMYTVAADGSGTHPTISAAIAAGIALATCTRVYIRLMPGTYREQVVVPSKTSAPPLTLYSTDSDAAKTVIVGDGAAATKGNITNSATMRVQALWGFQVKNITIANDYVEGTATGDQTAVALLNQADRAQFENVRILGNIGSLYVKSLDLTTVSRSYFRDCYLAGDQDIVFGRGTAVFDHSEIRTLTERQATGGVIAAPSTLVYNRYGFLFDSCQFTAEAGATDIALGRQWFESSQTNVVGKMVVRNSTLGAHVAALPWSTAGSRTTTLKDPAGTTPLVLFTSDDFYPAAAAPTPPEHYLAEYGNSGPGAHH